MAAVYLAAKLRRKRDLISERGGCGVKNRRILIIVGALTAVWLISSLGAFFLEKGDANANIKTMGDGLWWGVVTFLTVGYGDRFPVTTEGRWLASFLMMSGVAATGILTARISAWFLEEAILGRRRNVDERLKGHLIICGWRDDMKDLLEHLVSEESGKSAEKIVLVGNMSREKIDKIREDKRFQKLNFVVGDFFRVDILQQAFPERASRVLILADRAPSQTGMSPSAEEADARTIMAATALSKLAKTAFITAEIIDPNLSSYLRMAGVTDIIYSRQYSRLLLGTAASGTGLANVLNDLLDPKSGTALKTVNIPEALYNLTYSEVCKSMDPTGRTLFVGLIEHSGNAHTIRDRALRDAQKTSNVKKLIDNLQSVKQIRCNSPVFNPAAEYVVRPGSVLIVIRVEKDAARVSGAPEAFADPASAMPSPMTGSAA